MTAHLTRRADDFDEAAALREFADGGLRPTRWSNDAGDVYASHRHSYHKILYCLRGEITFELTASGERFELFPGDRLEIEPGIEHAAHVGADGVECIEAARYAE